MVYSMKVYDSVNDFLAANAWWMALIAAGLIALVIFLIIFSGRKRKQKSSSSGEETKKEVKKKIDYRNKEAVKTSYFAALGGEENILERKIEGSRISLKLSDYSKIDKEKLKEAGVDGFIQMSSKLYLVVKSDASKVYKILFGEE